MGKLIIIMLLASSAAYADDKSGARMYVDAYSTEAHAICNVPTKINIATDADVEALGVSLSAAYMLSGKQAAVDGASKQGLVAFCKGLK
jgi:hypothetical protein